MEHARNSPILEEIETWRPKQVIAGPRAAEAITWSRRAVAQLGATKWNDARTALGYVYKFLSWAPDEVDFAAAVASSELLERFLVETTATPQTAAKRQSVLRRVVRANGVPPIASDAPSELVPSDLGIPTTFGGAPRTRAADDERTVEDAIAGYRHSDVEAARWAAVSGWVAQAVRRSCPHTADAALDRCRVVGFFAAWAHDRHLPLDDRTLSEELIQRFLADARFAPNTTLTYQSLLRVVATGGTSRPRSPLASSARSQVRPYTSADLQSILESIQARRWTKVRVALENLVYGAMGAGLQGGMELGQLRAAHVAEHDGDLVIQVHSWDHTNDVLVWSREARMAGPLVGLFMASIAASQALGLEYLIGGESTPAARQKRSASLLDTVGAARWPVPLEIQRLRDSFFMDALSRPVHLPSLLSATGLRTLDSIARYVDALTRGAERLDGQPDRGGNEA
jgi:hypothetical protein